MSEADLSDEIARSLARNIGEQVTCRRVAPNHYRCNWWALRDIGDYSKPTTGTMLVTTSRICRSRFLRVIKSGDQLSVTVIPPGQGISGQMS